MKDLKIFIVKLFSLFNKRTIILLGILGLVAVHFGTKEWIEYGDMKKITRGLVGLKDTLMLHISERSAMQETVINQLNQKTKKEILDTFNVQTKGIYKKIDKLEYKTIKNQSIIIDHAVEDKQERKLLKEIITRNGGKITLNDTIN